MTQVNKQMALIRINETLSQIPEGEELPFLYRVQGLLRSKKLESHKNYKNFLLALNEAISIYEKG